MAATQPTQHRVIAGRQFLQALLDAGVVSAEENVTRVVIDARAGEFVKLYVERAGDERLLEVARNTTLEITESRA